MPLLCSAVLFLLMTAANAAIMWGKINETGQYTTLHGITLISHIIEPERWQPVFDFLETNNELRKYYSPLPISSYHMTTQKEHDYNPGDFSTWLMSMQQRMTSIQEKLDIWDLELKPVFREVSIGNMIIGISMHIPPAQNEVVQILRKHVGEQALLHYKPDYGFHITLAYRYRTISNEIMESLRQGPLTKLREIFKTILAPNAYVVPLKNPALCIFNDMAAFHPTDPRQWVSYPVSLTGELDFPKPSRPVAASQQTESYDSFTIILVTLAIGIAIALLLAWVTRAQGQTPSVNVELKKKTD